MRPGCTKAVILAAGGGTRITSVAAGKPKCLIPLSGRPIIEWIIDALVEGGIEEIAIVTGFGADVLKQAVGDGRDRNVRIGYVHNPDWSQPNGLSLYAARRLVPHDETFLTLMSDHILPPSIIKRVARVRASGCVLAVDMGISRVFDLSDATKVRVIDGVPVAIGKRLRKYNAVDCGLFRFDHRVFAALEAAFNKGRKALSDGVKVLIANGDLEALPVGEDMFWIDIDTPKAYRRAEREMGLFRPATRTGRGKRECQR